MAAVPRRAGRPPARPCWSSRTCTGPTTRCCASSSCSARPRGTCRCCCSCTARPELVDRDPSWAGTITGSLTITLPPLRDTGHRRRCTRTCSARRRSPPTCSSPLVELADGNPLYAHEYVRMLIEQGALRQSGRGWSLATHLEPADAGQRPRGHRQPGRPARRRPTARCCRPPPWWACSSGRARSPPRWAARSSRSSGRCAGWSSATSCTSSRTSTMAGQPEYRFRHVLVRDVCYQRLPRTERVARHERTADWLDALSREPRHRPGRGARPPPLGRARDRPHARRGHRPVRPGRPRRAAPGRPAGVRAARPGRRRRRTSGRALRRCADDDADPVDRLRLELLATEIAFYRDGTRSSPAAGPTSSPRSPTGCYAGRRRGLRGPGLDAARPGGLAARRPARRAVLPGPRGRAVRRRCRTRRRRPTRTPSWAGCTCSTTSATRRSRRPARRRRSRSGWATSRRQTNARITVGDGPLPGRRPGRPGRAVRRHRLLPHPAAARAAPGGAEPRLRAARGGRLDPLRRAARRGRHGRPGWAHAGHRLLRRGDARLLRAAISPSCSTAADAFVDTPDGRWDMQVRGLRACLRVLRDEPVPRAGRRRRRRRTRWRPARGSGFHRLRWTTLGLGALCRALQGRRDEAAELLDELATSWSAVPRAGQRRVDRRGRVRRRAVRAGRVGAGARACSTGSGTAPRGPRRRCAP